MNTDECRSFDSLTGRVLSAILEVSNTLGARFWEKVNQGALLQELRLRGMRATAQASFTITYVGQSAGEYFADILVEDLLVIELNSWGGSTSPGRKPDGPPMNRFQNKGAISVHPRSSSANPFR